MLHSLQDWSGDGHSKRLVYAWKGGHEGNVGYGSQLDTVVTWTLSRVENGTRLRLVHSGRGAMDWLSNSGRPADARW